MSWFYNKAIDVYTFSSAKDAYGIDRKGYTLAVTNVDCDVQPYFIERAKIEYGYNIDCEYRIFCDLVSEITENAVIKYNGNYYSVQKLIEWDDYLEILILNKYDVVILDGGTTP